MEWSPSSEADSSSTSKIPLSWWYLPVHYYIYKCDPPVSILNQNRPIHASPSHLLEIHFAVILPSMPRSSKCFLSLTSPNQKTTTVPFSHTCHMLHPSHSVLDLTNNICWAVPNMSTSCSEIPITIYHGCAKAHRFRTLEQMNACIMTEQLFI